MRASPKVKVQTRSSAKPREWKREQYLRYVVKLGHERALRLAQLTPLQWQRQMHKHDAFRIEVRRLTGMTAPSNKSPTERYLKALEENWGNQVKARKAAGFTKDDITEMRLQKKFRDLEMAVMESIVAEIEEQNVRVMTGDAPKVKDTGHLRWGLGHLIPDKWGEKPRVVDIHHHTEREIEEDIRRLQAITPPSVEEEADKPDAPES